MYSTRCLSSASSRPRKSATSFPLSLAELIAGASEPLVEALELDQFLDALAGREFQVLADQRAIDVLLVGLDHRIDVVGRRLVHGGSVPLADPRQRALVVRRSSAGLASSSPPRR